MRKRLFAALLAASLTLSVSIGCMTAFASQTEADGTQTTEAEAALASSAADETEAETEADLLEPESVTGESSLEAQYPSIEKQVEQQLATLSKLSVSELENMITSYNRQINLSVRDIANSMKDSSTLTKTDDATMAMVKMLRNWYSSMDSCGEFKGVKENFILDIIRDEKAKTQVEFSPRAVNCPTCASTFDAVVKKHCPNCGTRYDLVSKEWTILKIQKEIPQQK